MRVRIHAELHSDGRMNRDVQLLSTLVMSAGHELEIDDAIFPSIPSRKVDVNIFLERIRPRLFDFARENWLFPNPEWAWWTANDAWRKLDKVLCKTPHAYAVLTGKLETLPAVEIGFESMDVLMPKVVKQPRFLHVSRRLGSTFKNTLAVVKAVETLLTRGVDIKLTIVSRGSSALASRCPQIAFTELIGDDALFELYNSHQFLLSPSSYEGWGHPIHEALSAGSVVITTDASPMRDFPGVPPDLLVRTSGYSAGQSVGGLVDPANVGSEEIAGSIELALKLEESRRLVIGREARASFLETRQHFRHAFLSLLGQVS